MMGWDFSSVDIKEFLKEPKYGPSTSRFGKPLKILNPQKYKRNE